MNKAQDYTAKAKKKELTDLERIMESAVNMGKTLRPQEIRYKETIQSLKKDGFKVNLSILTIKYFPRKVYNIKW